MQKRWQEVLANFRPAPGDNYRRRLIGTAVAVVLMGLGVSLCLSGHVGIDPFGSFNKGLGAKLGLSLGVFQPMVNCVIIVAIFYFLPNLIGPGMLINMFGVGALIDFFNWLHGALFSFQPTLLMGALHLALGLFIFTFGISLHILARLGVGPYDGIALIIIDRFPGASFRFWRVVQDVACMLGGYFLGGPVGAATVILAFGIGPLVTFWSRHVTRRFLGLSLAEAL